MFSTQIWLSRRVEMESLLQKVFTGMAKSITEYPAKRATPWILRALQDQEMTRTIRKNTKRR
jgi:hypothetical protein